MTIEFRSSGRTRPDFHFANKRAKDVLWELDYPKPPIPLMELVRRRKWKLIFEDLAGVDGKTDKRFVKGKLRFCIFLANDLEEINDTEVLERRRLYTLAHEIGHIILHPYLDWNRPNAVMEVEANWFASRLLMPDYIFETIEDLKPAHLAEKCNVNISAARIRINQLNSSIRNDIINRHYGPDPVEIEPIEDFTLDDLYKPSRDVPIATTVERTKPVYIEIADQIVRPYGDYLREAAVAKQSHRTCSNCKKSFPDYLYLPQSKCTFCGNPISQ